MKIIDARPPGRLQFDIVRLTESLIWEYVDSRLKIGYVEPTVVGVLHRRQHDKLGEARGPNATARYAVNRISCLKLIGCHPSRLKSSIKDICNIHGDDRGAALPIDGCWAILYLLAVLSKCKSLRSVELLTFLFDAPQPSFASLHMFLFLHSDILLRGTPQFVVVKEGAITSVQDI